MFTSTTLTIIITLITLTIIIKKPLGTRIYTGILIHGFISRTSKTIISLQRTRFAIGTTRQTLFDVILGFFIESSGTGIAATIIEKDFRVIAGDAIRVLLVTSFTSGITGLANC